MPKYSKRKASEQTQAEADRIASHIQRPGQTKEQTKLIAQGIQKGIDLYKKQQKAKARDLDKKQKKSSSLDSQKIPEVTPDKAAGKSHWLPWGLLALSWVSFGLLWLLSARL